MSLKSVVRWGKIDNATGHGYIKGILTILLISFDKVFLNEFAVFIKA